MLLIIMLVYTGGSFIVYKYKEALLKQEMKVFIQQNPNHQFASHLSFNLNELENGIKDFSWEDGGKEFKYNGLMYDVISTTTSNDTIHILALEDHNENFLNHIYTSFLKKQTKNNTSKRPLLKFFASLYIQPTNNKLFLVKREQLVHTDFYKNQYSVGVYSIDVPPPKV